MQTGSRPLATSSSTSEDFWRQLLQDFTAPTSWLGIDNSPLQAPAHLTHDLQLSVASTIALQKFARHYQLELRTIVYGAWALLSSRYSGEDDVVFGELRICEHSALSNYSDLAISKFINALPLRMSVPAEQSLGSWLQQSQTAWLDTQPHAHVSLATIQEGSNLTTLFESMVIFADDELLMATDRYGQTVPELLALSPCPLSLFVQVSSATDSINLQISYDSNRFEGAVIDRLVGHFQTLLESFVIDSQQSLASLPWLASSERDQLLTEWNDTATDYPKDKCLHQLFEEQVVRTPAAIALVFEEQSITYQDLNQRANQLAHYLQAQGVGSNVLVGILVERSIDMVVGLLGILKAGGAYVPLDPAYPADRLSYMLSDSQMTVLVAQQALLTILPAHQAQVVCLDTDWPSIAQSSLENPFSEVAPAHLAYVIYTSGSTGKPKGVQILQGAVTNFLSTMRSQPGLTATDVVLAVTTISFDIAVLELYLPLIVGAQVVLASRAVATDSVSLAQLIEKSQATFMQATPATWHLLLAAGWSGNANLKILCGGEALSFPLASELLPKVASLWNMYGPTEATVWATVREVTVADLTGAAQRALPIGKPIANTQTYILDPNLQPVPIGIKGELYIGGVQLAKGYLNRPDLTAEKFIAHPFSDQPGARLYRTGDLARYLPNGDIEYINRIDNQVKIRGYRIELGEIEVILATHPAVRQNVVLVREDLPGDKRLVAYLVLTDQQTITATELRYFLAQQLPIFMVPTAVVVLEAMPLTPNGKIDRRSLPTPTMERSLLDSDFVAPRNQLEESIAQIWQEVLGIEKISIHDNFFELGGNSLIAVRLLTKLSNAWGRNLPLTTFLQTQTIAQLAMLFDQEEISATWSSLVPIQPEGSKPPLFCIHAIWGNAFFYQKLVKYLDPDQPVYGLQAQGINGSETPCTSIPEMAANYIREIQRVQPQGPYYLGGFSFGSIIAFEMAQQLLAQGQKTALLAIFDDGAPTLGSAESEGKRKNPYFLKLAKLLSGSHRFQDSLDTLKWHLTVGKLGIPYRSYLRHVKRSLPDLYLLQVHLANHQASRSYGASVYPGCLNLFLCEEALVDDSPDLGWGNLVLGEVEISLVPGTHTTIMEEPLVQKLAEKLTPCLRKAQQEHPNLSSE